MHPELKQRLHLLVDNCNDEYLLEEAKAVLESSSTGKDWWDELSEEDKEQFLEGEEEHLLLAARASTRPWLEAAIIISLETCMRQSELAGLTWDRVNLSRARP